MTERADLIDQVMNWEAEAITTKDSLKEAELTRVVDIANRVDKALAKLKGSDEFVALLKKDHDTGFDDGVEAIFYNIWKHYWDLDYAFLGGELTDHIGEWLENERLNALDVMSPFAPLGPSTRNVVAPDPTIASEDPTSEQSLRVTTVQPLINLEEEPAEAAVNPTTI